MNFTDLFIKRPVLATVISLLILVLGLRSLFTLPILQFPQTENAVVTITTVYTGADSEVIAGFITTPLENSIAQANGIDYLTSSSSLGVSTIQAYLKLNYDSNKAVSEINTKVNAVLNQLPSSSQAPTITVSIGQTINAMYISFYSDILPRNKITDYLVRVVQPKLQAVDGVQTAEILGGRQIAMRIWLDPAKLSSYRITANEVSAALAKNDIVSAIGRTNGQMMAVDLKAETGLSTAEEFKNLIVKAENGAIIRLSDVGEVTLGAQNYDTNVQFNNTSSVYIGIKVAPAANLLTVIEDIRRVFPAIQQDLPSGIEGKIVYDSTKFINSSINEVTKSLIEALIIVTLVIFVFLGSLRSVIIPVLAIPLSLIGAFLIMDVLNYSTNLLTLLALVLAIGLVVDDAIIVVENIQRHMDDGLSRLEASLMGTRELANPIIAISIVLIAVFIPIGFMGGLTGALFSEFAFTLAGAVGISAIIALTLSPMMCSRFLQESNNKSTFIQRTDHYFNKLHQSYDKQLKSALNNLPVTAVFAVIILLSIGYLYSTSKSELAPQEDQGLIISQLTTAPNATLGQTQLYADEIYKIYRSFSETEAVFAIIGAGGLNKAINGMILKPWDERTKTSNELQPLVQAKLDGISAGRVAAFQMPSLPGASGLPIQFVIQTTDSFQRLNEVSQSLIDQAMKSGQFFFLDSDLKIDKAQVNVTIDRNKAAQLGFTMQDIASALGSALSNGYINYFNFDGRAYQVIPQVSRANRLNTDQILDYYLTTADGTSIPLSTLAEIKTGVTSQSLNHFQQANAATISAVAVPGVSMGTALDSLKNLAKNTLPQGYTIDYAGQSRQFKQEGTALILTFFFALIIIFLSLAALFESFRDPLTVLISVPMSICGAMIFVSLGVGGATLNIYTEIGLVTLIGLISKHGILIVQFANDLQKEGKSKREAIEMAASIRLRPILMTTTAMVLGVVPLIFASGAGAVSRYSIGLVIASGISIGTLFTLFVVPAIYMFLAENHAPKSA